MGVLNEIKSNNGEKSMDEIPKTSFQRSIHGLMGAMDAFPWVRAL